MKTVLAAIIIVALASIAGVVINHITSNSWGAIGGGLLTAFVLWIIWEEIGQ